MKNNIIKIIRRLEFQAFWEKVNHLSKIGMNYWGGAAIKYSGEMFVMGFISENLNYQEKIIIFDVGANLGQFAKSVLSVFPIQKTHIYAFEPSLKSFELLVQNVKEYSDNIDIFNFGFGDLVEERNLYSSGVGSSLASVYNLTKPIHDFKEEFTEKIKLDTIDNFCSLRKIDVIDFLKIDVEGHEFNVLKGAVQKIESKKIKYIQFEFGENHVESRTFFKDFYDLLSRNYNLYRIVPNGLRKIHAYSTELEVFHTINYLAALKHLPGKFQK